MTPMQRPRSSGAVAVMNSNLYCAGGFSGRQHVNSVERYDPAADAWEECTPMWNMRYALGLAAITVPVTEEANISPQRTLDCRSNVVHAEG